MAENPEAGLCDWQPGFLCDTPGKRLPCLHEQPFAGQRTANSLAVSCPGIAEIGEGKELPLSDR